MLRVETYRTPNRRRPYAGHDAFVIAPGSNGLRDKTTLSVGTGNIVAGMVRHNIDHQVVLSVAGVGESWA